MTDAELVEIERLAKEATPGPWSCDLDVFGPEPVIEACVFPVAVTTDLMLFTAETSYENPAENDAYRKEVWQLARASKEMKNAKYIAAVNPSAVLDLITTLRRHEALLQQTKTALEALERGCDCAYDDRCRNCQRVLDAKKLVGSIDVALDPLREANRQAHEEARARMTQAPAKVVKDPEP